MSTTSRRRLWLSRAKGHELIHALFIAFGNRKPNNAIDDPKIKNEVEFIVIFKRKILSEEECKAEERYYMKNH
jgi:hypothetical protein